MRTLALIAALALSPANLFAFGSASKGTAGAQFLKIAPGARAVGLGEAFGGVAEGVYSAYYNPAGLAALRKVELGAARDQHFQGISHHYGVVAVPLLSWKETRRKRNELGVAAFSITSLSISDIERRGTVETDAPLGTFGASDFAYTLSYGYPFSRELSLGASIKYIRQTLDSTTGSGAALDAGALWVRDRWSAGAGLRNLGKGVKLGSTTDPLPTVFYGGAGFRPAAGWLTALEIRQASDDSVLFSLGLERSRRFSRNLSGALRAGFNSANTDADGFGGATLGAGFVYKTMEFGLAWAPMGDLGNTFRYSLRVQFGK
jgi:hypothetical protein